MSPFWSTYFPTALWIIIIWSLTGLWHGASWKYVFYGFYYGVIMTLEMIWDHYTGNKAFRKTWWYKTIAITATFCMVNVGMLFFKADGLRAAYDIFLSLFHIQYYDLFAIFSWKEMTIALSAFVLVFAIDICYEKQIDLKELLIAKHHVWLFAAYAILIIAIIFVGAYGHGYTYIDPIYGGF
jgi:D-alanyl-lipoteichoic acid acyltransferase DltB (MBOAT superfamily)